jgi:hypothetical protein
MSTSDNIYSLSEEDIKNRYITPAIENSDRLESWFDLTDDEGIYLPDE